MTWGQKGRKIAKVKWDTSKINTNRRSYLGIKNLKVLNMILLKKLEVETWKGEYQSYKKLF